jgi:hypothetical protein
MHLPRKDVSYENLIDAALDGERWSSRQHHMRGAANRADLYVCGPDRVTPRLPAREDAPTAREEGSGTDEYDSDRVQQR